MTLHAERVGDGPDLVLLHGWGMHSGVWSEAMPGFAKRCRVHAVDLPGHGNSSGTAASTLDDAADRVAACVPIGAIICGWSLGGLVAQRIAARHPGTARALVLVSSTPCFVTRPDWPHAMGAATLETFATGLHTDREATLASFVRLNALHGVRGREAIRAFTSRLADRGAPSEDSLAASLGWLRDTDLRAHAPRLPRTLVIHGARDALTPVQAARWLATTAPDVVSLELPDAAHIPFFTHREPFMNALESFVG